MEGNLGHGPFDRLLTAAAVLIAAAGALGLAGTVSDGFTAGTAAFLAGVSLAVFLLKRDSSPGEGVIFLTAALGVGCVLFWGGADGPAGFLYPVLFLWIRRDSISGRALMVASVAASVEFLAPLASSSGLILGDFRVVSALDSMTSALIAGIVPLISLTAVDLLREERSSFSQPETSSSKEAVAAPAFPDDIARSLIPVLKKATAANGVFLFRSDERDVSTLNEYLADQGAVSSKYLAGPDDPVIELVENAESDIVHTTAEKLSLNGSPGLPWYIRDSGSRFVTILRFTREGRTRGFMVLDFTGKSERESAAPILVDTGFILSLAWERSRETNTSGFLDICEEMSRTRDIRGSVHRLISTVIRLYPGTTATVAVLGEGDVLRVFESIGPCSEGRAGREFPVIEGFAGLAVKKKEPLRRLRMGVGQKASRTFGESDDPGRWAGSCCAVPLLDMGTVLGVLTVESENEQFFAPEDLALFTAFATVFSLAVSRNGLVESLERIKTRDHITGLPLLSRFHAGLTDMVRGVQSRAWSITVLAVDINGFREINGTFGYEAGDTVLRETAIRLRRAVGREALISRAGSDDFLVCLQAVDRVSAEAYASRIHEEFDDAPVIFRGREIEVKVCIGGAVSHVDRMIRRLPGIASGIAGGLTGRPGVSSITEVGQFYEVDRQ